MPAPKGSYNARRYHEGTAQSVEASVKAALASIRPTMVFRTVSALAEHIAPQCMQTAGNLRRNRRYRALLEDHVARQPGAVALLPDSVRSQSVLRAKLLEVSLRAANTERDKKRLEAYIAKHLEAHGREAPRLSSARKSLAVTADGPDYRQAFECTAMALQAVLADAQTYDIDQKSGALIDRSARPGSPPVVGDHLMSAYIEWLARTDGPPRKV